MREVFRTVAQWLKAGTPCALGTLVQAVDSAPAPIGATVAVDGSGRVAGNIGAGCYESEIVDACSKTIEDGDFRLVPIDLSSTDEITGSPGCGGTLTIAVWKPLPAFAEQAEAIARGMHDVTVPLAQNQQFTIAAKQRICIVGATTLANEIARIGASLDFAATIVDPRPIFATADRMRDADEILAAWPGDALPRILPACRALIVVSHDPKFDLPALQAGLDSSVAYIGLLGSRRSQAARRAALAELGYTDAQLSRIHGPAGLDIGCGTPGQSALSILAHIVAESNNRSGTPLERTAGPIRASAQDDQAIVSTVSTSK